MQQQERFDAFVEEFNYSRPHQALDHRRPGDFYRRSEHLFDEAPDPINYDLDDMTRTVYPDGRLTFRDRKLFRLTPALAGENVGLRELEAHRWLVSYAQVKLGWLDDRTMNF